MNDEPEDNFSVDEAPPSFEARRRLRFGIAVLVGVVSAAGLVILLNYLAARHLRWRHDLTSVDRFELSPLTQQLLPTADGHRRRRELHPRSGPPRFVFEDVETGAWIKGDSPDSRAPASDLDEMNRFVRHPLR